MSKYWSAIVTALDPYVPGEQPKVENLIKLNTNESPYGPSPRAILAMQEQASASLRLYPDPNADILKDAIARYYEISAAEVFVGNGSDEVLAHTFQALLQHEKPLLIPEISYSFYPVYCGLYRVDCIQVPLREGLVIDLADYERENGGILFANPNAPTGRGVALTAIERLVRTCPDSVVVVDEAYVDFGGESAVGLIRHYDNLLVVQTFSKSRSLAGLRVGFAMGNPDLIEALERVKNSFNSYPLDRFAISGAAAAIDDREYFDDTRNRIVATRDKMTKDLQRLGFEVIPSQANFVFARHKEHDAAVLNRALRDRNILVRHFKKPGIDQFLRISVGTDYEYEQLILVLSAIMEE